MTNVPQPDQRDVAILYERLSEPVFSVSDVAVKVDLNSAPSTVMMTISTIENRGRIGGTQHFALSPTAAFQLAKGLRRAVKQYLAGESGPG